MKKVSTLLLLCALKGNVAKLVLVTDIFRKFFKIFVSFVKCW